MLQLKRNWKTFLDVCGVVASLAPARFVMVRTSAGGGSSPLGNSARNKRRDSLHLKMLRAYSDDLSEGSLVTDKAECKLATQKKWSFLARRASETFSSAFEVFA